MVINTFEKRTVINYDKELNKTLERIKNSKLNKKDKELILSFYKYLYIKGLSKIRIVRYISSLYKVAKFIPLNELSKNNIISFIYYLKTKNYSSETIKMYILSIKYFLKMLDKKYYNDLSNIKTEINIRTDYIDFSTFQKIISLIDQKEYKLFTMFLYDSGARPSEAYSASVDSCIIKDNLIIFLLNGKTKVRELYISIYKKEIEKLIYEKQKKGEKYLFNISYDYYTRKILKKVQTTLNLKKLYPYMFRHSRATDLANKLTETQLKKFFGWSENTKMLKRYIKREFILLPYEKLIPEEIFVKKCVCVQDKTRE